MSLRPQSDLCFREALRLIPGGVNSPVRAFRAVGGDPFFVDRAKGSRVYDVDGREYVDYVGTWGPAILGHAAEPVIQAIMEAAPRGTSFGIPNPLEVTMARQICEAVNSVEKVRMCNSGTEATMSAIRLARGFTGREKIVKFAGCYHGHVDSLLVKAGSGALTLGQPDSAGVPPSFTEHTIVVPFNDQEAVRKVFEVNSEAIAGIILEPVPANAGLYLPEEGFLEFLQEQCQQAGALLIFDEVMTGFRLARGGAQARFGLVPDLSCFGKIIGGGLPVGAFGGRAEIMDCLAPVGAVYQAGTLSGNPLAMAAGLATLEALEAGAVYDHLEDLGSQLEAGMVELAQRAGVPVRFHRLGSMFCLYFTDQEVRNLAGAMDSDGQRYARYFHGMMEHGIYLAPSPYESGFLSAAHNSEDVEATLEAAYEVMNSL